jgi:TolA-binding protein
MKTNVASALIAMTLLAACGGDKSESNSEFGVESADERSVSGGGVRVTTGANDSTALADADVQITSTDGSITLAVLHDSVVMQLSDSLRQSVKDQVDSSTSNAGDGMGAAIAKVVGSAVSAAVSSAMGIAVKAPASQVKELRYENGRLFFKVEGSNVKFNTKGNNNSDGAPFTEADAKRFIEAVDAAKARTSSM